MLFSGRIIITECIFEYVFQLICLCKHSCSSIKRNHWEFCQPTSEQGIKKDSHPEMRDSHAVSGGS